MKLIFKIISKILIGMLTLILLLVLYNFINLSILKKDYTNYFGFTMFEVASGSMSPTIEEKDVVFVKINSDIKTDDIITYKKDGAYITHRVLDIQGEYYICRGDANNTNDEPIKKDIILGKVVKVMPKLGLWKEIIATPKVLISIIVTIFLFGLGFTYKVTNNFKDFSISRKTIIEGIDNDEKDDL